MMLPDPTTAPPWHEARPTNLEFAKWLAATSDANRDAVLQRHEQAATEASECFLGDHKREIGILLNSLREARARIDWLERHYHSGAS